METSSSFSELWAIAKAVEIAVEDKVKKLVVFTDSLTACHLLDKKESTNYIVALIHNTLKFSDLECELVWIPGHVGIKINETADELAKWAVKVGAPL